MRNAGFEFTIKGVILDKPNFVWDASVMGSLNRNKVLKLTQESNQILQGARIIKEGMPIYTFFMSKNAGVDKETGKQLYYAYEKMEEDGTIVGEYITDDYSKAATSKYYLGSREPKLSGSLSMNFKILKNFDLSVLGTYSLGGKIMGAKTGYVVQSGNCAASFYERDDGNEFICVTADAHSGWRAIYDHVAAYNIYAAGNTSYTKQ